MKQLLTRIEHFTWAQFANPLSGGGIAVALKEIPYRFRGLEEIGDIVFIFNFSLLCLLAFAMLLRAIIHPKVFFRSFVHKNEAPFIPFFLMAGASFLMAMYSYANGKTGAWFVTCMRILFWIHVALSITQLTIQYLIMFYFQTLRDASPSWLLFALPSMLIGAVAATIADAQPPDQAIPIIIGGVTFQILGLNMSMVMYGILFTRFLIHGLPPPSMRPSLCITIGPMSYTGFTFVALGQAAPEKFYSDFITSEVASGAVFKVIGLFVGVACWATCLFFFGLACLAVAKGIAEGGMTFRLAWFAMVFPNVGWILLTIRAGTVLDSPAVKWVGTIMAVFFTAVYLFCLACWLWALTTERIMSPGRDENMPYENIRPDKSKV